MAGFTQGSSNIISPNVLGNGIINALKSANSVSWFTELKYIPATEKDEYLLESTANVDSFVTTDATQKYRLHFILAKDASGNYTNMTMSYGDSDQLKVNSNNNGIVVATGTPKLTVFNSLLLPSISREVNYRITFTDRGWALAIWPTAQVNQQNNNFICVIQRPVNPTTGLPKIEGKAPIFALWHDAASVYNYFDWGIVRELDVSASRIIGDTSTPSRYNMYKVTMDWAHPNLFDNNSHVVKFAYGFATPRHLYLDELDMMCMVNASAFAGQQDVNITMYGEATPRNYRTTWGEVSYGTTIGVTRVPKSVAGARLGILTVGGGI